MSNVTDKDYTFMENPMSENWAVRILTGKWKDVIYSYGKIGLSETPDDQFTLRYNYSIIDFPEDFGEESTLTQDADFNNHLGDILVHILEDSIQNEKFKLGNKDNISGTHADTGSQEPAK
jgi:hypothetical protein